MFDVGKFGDSISGFDTCELVWFDLFVKFSSGFGELLLVTTAVVFVGLFSNLETG